VGAGKDDNAANGRRRDLAGQDFEGRQLRFAVLLGAPFDKANLRSADLLGANLGNARLDAADLRGCDLRDAILDGAHLEATSLDGADLRGLDLAPVWNLDGCTLRSADLRGLKAIHATVKACDFSRSDLRGADLSGARLDRLSACRFRGALYDDGTKWPPGFDPSAVGAGKGERSPPIVLEGEEPEAADLPPSDTVVKRVSRQRYEALRLAWIQVHPTEAANAPVDPPHFPWFVEFRALAYALEDLPPEGPFPVRVECVVGYEESMGSVRFSERNRDLRFRRADGYWICEFPAPAAAEK
jgi:hypothetical protein